MFCMTSRRQMDDGMCDCSRCYALQVEHQAMLGAGRPEGKLCFMELTEAVAASLPRLLAVGDTIDTATWGQFVVMDDYSCHWLNDFLLILFSSL